MAKLTPRRPGHTQFSQGGTAGHGPAGPAPTRRARPRGFGALPACAPSWHQIELEACAAGAVRARAQWGRGAVVRPSGGRGRRGEAGSLVSAACGVLESSRGGGGGHAVESIPGVPRSPPRQASASEFLGDLDWGHRHWESHGEGCLALFLGSRSGKGFSSV